MTATATNEFNASLDQLREAQREQAKSTFEYNGEMRVMMARDGDIKYKWRADVQHEVELARAAFDKAIAKGFRAFRIDAKGNMEGQPIKTFDPAAEQIVLVPQIVGGAPSIRATRQSAIDLLGLTATDRVTGFKGVISTISYDLFGCVQAILSPPIDKDGKRQEGMWFDVNRLNVSKAIKRVMEVPDFTHALPETHTKGPAEKPARSRD